MVEFIGLKTFVFGSEKFQALSIAVLLGTYFSVPPLEVISDGAKATTSAACSYICLLDFVCFAIFMVMSWFLHHIFHLHVFECGNVLCNL